MKEKKKSQLNIRISDQEKDEISKIANNAGYKSLSKYLINLALNNIEVKTNDKRRIYIVSLSTALDYFISINKIDGNKSGTNKFLKEDIIFAPGGRGINLSRVLNAFNISNLNINFSDGFAGKELYRILDEQGVKQHRIESGFNTKINVYAEDSEGRDISLEEKSTPLSSYAKEELINFINNNLKESDEFVLSGSFAKDDVPFIKKILKMLKSKGVDIYINSSSQYINEVIKNIEPKLIVLCSRNFSGIVKSKNEIFDQMKNFIDLGCENVAFVSDVNYSLFMNKEHKFLLSTKLVEKLTYSGLEDAFVAGYISNIDKDIETQLKWSAASVRAKSEDKKEIHFDQIVNFLKEVDIKEC